MDYQFENLVTASEDETARVWDTATGIEVTTLYGHSGPVISAAFSSDGRSVVTVSGDQMARVFRCELCGSVEELLELATKRVGRGLDVKRTPAVPA
jgi:WD40 repeat protein